MDETYNVPVDNPNADTEWNDILRKHGIIPEKPPDPEPVIQEAILEAQKRAHENRLENKDIEELDELEDEEDEEFLQKYRRQRLSELSKLQKTAVHGQVYPLQKPDYARDVTDASSKYFVLVHLSSPFGTNAESRVLGELWKELAKKFGDIKFCEIRADLCIEGYPERNTPTILVYKNGDIVRQFITLREFNGPKTSLKDLEKMLLDVGAVQENDMRMRRRDSDENFRSARSEQNEDDDEDWD